MSPQCLDLHYEVASLLIQVIFVHGVLSLLTGVFYRI
jgi:hypothetical protein